MIKAVVEVVVMKDVALLFPFFTAVKDTPLPATSA